MRNWRIIFAMLLVAPLLAAAPATQAIPDIVVLKELSARYEAVPFDHKSHAAMAEMWDGCTTCHHRKPTTHPTTSPVQDVAKTQANAGTIPACKSCHDVSNERADLHRPNLKGAYHRQCLNCHREWANQNACEACHKPLKSGAVAATTPAPSKDDIVGRMHPPLPEPKDEVYTARFIPAVGDKVMFRHKEHTTTYGLKCVNCHRRDNCSDCHDGKISTIAHKPINPGRTWKDSHTPCMGCHEKDRCAHCHYDGKSTPPAVFEHRTTGQLLDKDHSSLKCGQCHNYLKSNVNLTCGGASCHAKNPAIAYPAQRPGPTVTTRPTVQVAIAPAPATQPTTRAVIKRIRR